MKIVTGTRLMIGMCILFFTLFNIHCNEARAVEFPTQILKSGGENKQKIEKAGSNAIDFILYCGMILGSAAAAWGFMILSTHTQQAKRFIGLGALTVGGCFLFYVIAGNFAGFFK